MCYLSQFLGSEAKPVGQGTMRTVRLCSTMSEASARRAEGWTLGSAEGSVTHMPGG